MIDRSPAARTTPIGRAILGRIARAIPRRIAGSVRRRTAVHRLTADRREVARILELLAADRPDAPDWTIRDARPGDPAIFVLGAPRGGPVAVVRVAHAVDSRAGLLRAAAALDQLHGVLERPGPGALLPDVIGRGTADDRSWLVESALPGVPARPLAADPAARRRLLGEAAAVIGAIHQATGQQVAVGDGEIEPWVHDRSRIIAHALAGLGRSELERDRLAAIEAELASGLRGQVLTTGWVHGDLWLANILVDPDGLAVTGLVDWDSASPAELPLHDRLHLAVTSRRLVERRPLGHVIADLLVDGRWTDDDRAVLGPDLGTGPSDDGPLASPDQFLGIGARAAIWLYWLRAVETNLGRHPDLARDRRWLTANVQRVLACP